MEDRELLELAAEASGFWICQDAEHLGCEPLAKGLWVKSEKYGNYRQWNPLEDDGDAFRLAAYLRFKVIPGKYAGDGCSVNSRNHEIPGVTVFHMAEQMRRAIVMAAAEIGKTMQ